MLHNFNSAGTGGTHPCGVIFDPSGKLYGATGCVGGNLVFQLYPEAGGKWGEKVLRRYTDKETGENVQATLALDASGNLYGTTYGGGAEGAGLMFELTPTPIGQWTETALYSAPYEQPLSGLMFGPGGNCYGVVYGALQWGAVFELSLQANRQWMEQISVHLPAKRARRR